MTSTEKAAPAFDSDDDDGANDGLVLARLDAWARGQSLGPDVHGIPRRQPRPASPDEEALIASAYTCPTCGGEPAQLAGDLCDDCLADLAEGP